MCDFSQFGGPSQEWLAVEATLPATTFDLSIPPETLKENVNKEREARTAKEMEKLAPLVQTATYDIPTRDGSTIQVRSYRPVSKSGEKLPLYVYFHGGGFIFGNLNGEDATCARLAINAGIVVLNVNYRHTPEHQFPVAWLDTQDAFAWAHKNASVINFEPSQVVIGGVSAGGQLTASLVLEKHLDKSEVMKGLPEIAGQVLIIPCLANIHNYAEGPLKKMASPSISSYVENENAPILPKKTVEFFVKLLKSESVDIKDTKINLVNADSNEVRELPPTVFGIAGLDPLRDEALLYAKLLSETNVPTETRLFKGVPHGFRRFGPALKASAEWDKCVEEGIAWALSKPSATGKFEVKVV